MKAIDSYPGYRQAIQKKHWKHLVIQVTTILINRLMIGDGNNLVGLIGCNDARTNKEAIHTWVENSMGYTETRSPNEVANYLSEELVAGLTNMNLYNTQYY